MLEDSVLLPQTSDLYLSPPSPIQSAGSDDGKHEHIRVSLEGVAQLGQLLCRMMLFPIFRSNNEYLHVCADKTFEYTLLALLGEAR